MKINFGNYKNRNIIVGDNKKMRPTQSMAKSIIFNILPDLNNYLVLDLFAGTGSLGFEALSLNALKVSWIDNNINSINAIKQNIDNLHLNKINFKAYKLDFRNFLKGNLKDKQYDLIFIDPPFIALNYFEDSLFLISKYNLLSKKGYIVLEKPSKHNIKNIDKFIIKKIKSFGDKDIIFLISK